MDEMYYFDNAATTHPKPNIVKKAMLEAICDGCGNAGRGSYEMAVQAVHAVDNLRDRLLECAGNQSGGHVILTSGATIAFNMLLGGINLTSDSVVYVSPFEHNAVIRVLYARQQKIHFTMKELPIKADSLLIDIEKTEYEFSRLAPDIVCISHISNVTGYILPVNEVCQLAKKSKQGAITIVDGCQALGLISKPLLENELIDYYVFAGHKTLYGPFGIGGIICNSAYGERILRNRETYTPYICGGTGSDSLNPDMVQSMPEMLEAGSMNILAVKGLLGALEEKEDYFPEEKEKTKRLVRGLEEIEGIQLYLPQDREKHINIVSFNIQGYQCQETGMILDEDYRIAVRTGYHCATLIHNYLKDREYNGTVRASIGRYTTVEEIEYLIRAVREITEER